MIEINAIQPQVSFSIIDKFVLFWLNQTLNLRVTSEIFNLVMFSKLFSILNEFYNRLS